MPTRKIRRGKMKRGRIVVAALIACLPPIGVYAARMLSAKPVTVGSQSYQPERILFASETVARSSKKPDAQRQVRSLLNIRKPMKYGQFVWNDTRVPMGRVWATVNLDTQTISVFRAGHEIGTAVIAYGADKYQTPHGTFAVLAKYRDHRSSLYEAAMPYTLRLTDDGISIHGSDVRARAATHGCVGVPTAFAAKLFDVVKVGDQVDLLEGIPATT